MLPIVVVSSDWLNGYDNGYNEGFNSGHTSGLSDGKSIAEQQFYNQGYSDGFNFATNGQDFSAGSFFRKTLDILDVELFGFISIADIFKIIVAVGLVIFSLKLFAGG